MKTGSIDTGPRVLIVGATSAVATEVAALFAARGAKLYLLGGRSREKMQALEQRLGSAVLGAETADIDQLEANPAAVERALTRLGRLDVAFVASGLLGDQLQSEKDVAVAAQIYQTNLLGVVSVLIPVANFLETQGGGQIVVLSSVAGDRGRPRNFTYASAKAGLNVYLEGLRSRLYPQGTRVQSIRLGPVDSPMTVDHPKNRLFVTPKIAAIGILRVMAGHARAPYVPWFWAPIMLLVKHAPEPIFQRFGFLSGR
jgi:NAD(P)-dependent dehydrogenase (short-subunit alcohol dehydrogenase family)